MEHTQMEHTAVKLSMTYVSSVQSNHAREKEGSKKGLHTNINFVLLLHIWDSVNGNLRLQVLDIESAGRSN